MALSSQGLEEIARALKPVVTYGDDVLLLANSMRGASKRRRKKK